MNSPAFLRFSLLALVAALTIDAPAETVRGTPILRHPHTITKPGSYVLTKDLTTAVATGAAITVAADHVMLDFNGHSLVGTAGASTAATGVESTAHSFITVKNGNIAGFDTGLALTGDYETPGLLVEGMTASGNSHMGILVFGLGARVRDCQVLDTGGDAFANTAGIRLDGLNGTVSHCDVMRTYAGSGEAHGIETLCNQAVVEANRVSNAHYTANSYGIVIFGIATLVSENRVMQIGTGIAGRNGNDVKAFNNLTLGTQTPFSAVTLLVGVNN